MRRMAGGILTTLLLLLICAVCYISIFFSSQTSEHLAALAEKSELAGSISRAAYFYEQSLIYNPYSASSRLKLATISIAAKRTDVAESILKNGIEVSPSNPSFYVELAKLYMSQYRLEDAVFALNSASGGYAGIRVGTLRPQVQGFFNIYGNDSAVHFKINSLAGTTYYYTLDGTVPGFGSPVYTHPILINHDTGTVSIIAVADELPSPVAKYIVPPQYQSVSATPKIGTH